MLYHCLEVKGDKCTSKTALRFPRSRASPLMPRKFMPDAASKLPHPTKLPSRTYLDCAKFPVAMRLGVTPVPIPNTTVKPQAAESTTLETTWEARWLPEL